MLGPLRRSMAVSRPRVVGLVTVGHGVNEFFSIVLPPIIPLLVSDLGITYGRAGFLVTTFFVMYVLFQLPAGVLADRVGQRRVVLVGLVGMGGGVLLASAADDYGTLLVAQAVAGIGGSTFHPAGMSVVSDVETGDTEGRAMGVFGLGGALGTLLSPLLVGGLAVATNWRVALAGAALVGLLATLATVPFLRVPGTDAESGEGTRTEAGAGRGGNPGTGTGAGGETGGRRRSGRPSLRRGARALRAAVSVPRGRGVVLLSVITLVLSLQHRAIQTYTTSYIAAETGTSVSVGNVAFFMLLLGGSVASVGAGDLADRFDRKLLGAGTAVGTAVLVGATVLVAPVFGGLPTGRLVVVLSLWFAAIGTATYASYPIKNALVSEVAHEGTSGSLFGVVQTASALGSASGPALFGVLATRWGVSAAFPAIAGVGLVLAALFVLLTRVD